MDDEIILPDNWEILIAAKDPEAIQLLHRIYKTLFNQTIQQGCGNCYQKAYFKIRKYWHLKQQPISLTSNSMNTEKRKYILKCGRSLQTSFGGDVLTNDNMTDEAAEKLLKAHPSLSKHFEVLPEVAETTPVTPPIEATKEPSVQPTTKTVD